MFGFLTKDKKYALCATETDVVFASEKVSKKELMSVQLLSSLEKEPDTSFETAALLAGTGRDKAKVALVLPLREFELVSVTVPPVSHEAVAKLLPYSLAKMLDVPVTDYIYDWQVAQKFKDRHELTVYLYSASTYKRYHADLLARQKEIVWFEPDVFAACSYLNLMGRPTGDETSLLLLISGNSVSITVFDNQRISFVRSVDIVMPEGGPGLSSAEPDTGVVPEAAIEERTEDTTEEIEAVELADFLTERDDFVEQVAEQEEEILTLDDSDIEIDTGDFFADDSHSADILSGFGLQATSSSPTPVAFVTSENKEEVVEESIPEEKNGWAAYFESLNLEIMRTRDYHTSVLKGKPVQEIYIGGVEHCFDEVAKAVQDTHNVDVLSFPPENIEAECSQVLAAMSIGALQR